MKKFSWLFLVASLFFVGKVHAAPQESDLRSKTVVLHSTWSFSTNLSTSVVLISLSSTTWPNPEFETGWININKIYISVDKTAASTCTIKVGVVTAINTSTGSVKYFFNLTNSLNVSNTFPLVKSEADNSFRCLKVLPNNTVDGITPFLMSNDITSGSSIFNSNTPLTAVNIKNAGVIDTGAGTYGVIAPNIGDIVMTVVNGTVATSAIVDIFYHYEQ